MPGKGRWGRKNGDTDVLDETVTPEFSDTAETTEPSETVLTDIQSETVKTDQDEEELAKVAPRPRVTVEDLGPVSDLVEDDDAPALTKTRSRNNPYDAPIWLTFEQKYAEKTEDRPRGRWIKQDVGNVEAAKRLIRNAAEHCNIGAEIRDQLVDDSNPTGPGTVWFRGKAKREIKRKPKNS